MQGLFVIVLLGDCMKKHMNEVLIAVLCGVVLPTMLMIGLRGRMAFDMKDVDGQTVGQTDSTQPLRDLRIPVLFSDGSVKKMELDTYITGVVLAEMPAEFDIEALKAQAVVARTYTMKRHSIGGKHPNASVCTDHTCCQAFCTEADFLAKGESAEMLSKIKDAVSATHGQVLTYKGNLIEATYFSCSGGKTEDALAVWGEEIPYLQAVDSPGEENASHYMDTVTFTADQFQEKLGIDLSGSTGAWISGITYTAGGGVDTIRIGNTVFKGTQVRNLLNLRSTAFVMTAVGNTVTVTTKGFGHRVGMSQYGADAMAVAGNDYKQILAYYYSGTTIEAIDA